MKNIYLCSFGCKAFCTVLLFICCHTSFSQNWYVNDGSTAGDVYTTAIGNNANPGTAAQPFATIDTAIARASSGDTIWVDAGDYFQDSVHINKTLTLNGAKAGVPAGPLAVPLNRGVNE
ncbi:MAG: DUF1565 domain-containing protein, partial [Chitinophagaceae bacterium]